MWKRNKVIYSHNSGKHTHDKHTQIHTYRLCRERREGTPGQLVSVRSAGGQDTGGHRRSRHCDQSGRPQTTQRRGVWRRPRAACRVSTTVLTHEARRTPGWGRERGTDPRHAPRNSAKSLGEGRAHHRRTILSTLDRAGVLGKGGPGRACPGPSGEREKGEHAGKSHKHQDRQSFLLLHPTLLPSAGGSRDLAVLLRVDRRPQYPGQVLCTRPRGLPTSQLPAGTLAQRLDPCKTGHFQS